MRDYVVACFPPQIFYRLDILWLTFACVEVLQHIYRTVTCFQVGQMRMCRDYLYYGYMLKVVMLLELCGYDDVDAVMDLLTGNLISRLLGHLLPYAQSFDGNMATRLTSR